MKPPLRILHLEDDPKDAELIQAMFEAEDIICHVMRVETRADFLSAIEQCDFDLILTDYALPLFDGLSALEMAREKCPGVPFIFVSGRLGEESAIETLKSGATDYVLKDRLSRLVPSVHRALREAEERIERKRVEEALRKAKDELEIRVAERTTELTNVNERLRFELTERKRMEEELLRVQKLESIGVLAGGIAHDFNNLLTAILGNISLTKMYANPEDKGYKRLTEAEKACLRARGLTQQLLTFSKGGAPIKKVAFIRGLIRDSASFALIGSNVRCEFSISGDLWPVEVDEGQISQVINNMVINADQAMLEEGVIRVRAENVNVGLRNGLPLKEGRYVKITIEDNGIGIPEEHLVKIFDPYFTTKQKGNGLGLATAYSIIKGHNGYIEVESEVGVGTKFYVYLPASQKEILAKREIKERPVIGRGRILVMDDEEIVRGLTGDVLGYLGYEVEFARDGREAIEKYIRARESKRPFDVVIMDLTIPGGMGGKEAIKRLIEIDPEVKAIVSSGYSNDPVMAEYTKYGFREVITKPYKIEELSKILAKVINEGTVFITV
jgi:signal transduction histidine kinase